KTAGSLSQVALRNRFATAGFVLHRFVSMLFLPPDPSQQLAFHPTMTSLHCPLLAILDTKRMSNKYKPNVKCK
ncbi:hypothetical protein N300_07477, partial [Calypte anna]